MSFFKSLFSKLGYVKMEDIFKLAKSLHGDTPKTEISSGIEPTPSTERTPLITYETMHSFYVQNEWVRACVDLISSVASRAVIKVKPKNISKEVSEETLKHVQTVQALFDNPNRRDESFNQIRKKIVQNLMIYDAAALEIVYDSRGLPYELYDIPGQLIRIEVDEHGNFKDQNKAYTLIVENNWGEKKSVATFSVKELIYFALNVGAGEVYGLSPLESLVNSILADLNATKYNASFFKNNAMVSGIVSMSGVTPKELEKLRKEWYKKHGGSSNAHKLLFINNDKVDFKKFTESAKDMQFLEYQKWLLNKIIAIYRVNPFVLGLIDETTGKLNSNEQWLSFLEKAIKPILQLEQYLYNTKLIQAGFGYKDVEVTFLPITESEEEDIVETVDTIAKTNIMTINEIRKKYFGLDEVPWGDVPYDLLKQGITNLRPPSESSNEKPSKEQESEKESKSQQEPQIYYCECLNCGYKLKSSAHCRDIKCPKCGGEMRRVNRPGIGKSITCKNCGQVIDLTKTPEVSLGITKCPNCGKLLDQEGNVVQPPSTSQFQVSEKENLDLKSKILNLIEEQLKESE